MNAPADPRARATALTTIEADGALRILSVRGSMHAAVEVAPGDSLEEVFGSDDAITAHLRAALQGAEACVVQTLENTTRVIHITRANGNIRATVSATPPRPIRPGEGAHTTLLDHVSGMAYRCRNDPSWTMELVSKGCLDITGYAADELLMNRDVAFGDLVHTDDADWLWASCQAGLDNQCPCDNTYRIKTKSGDIRWIRDQAHGIYSDSGELEFIEGLVTDVTEHRRVQEEEAKLREMLARAQRIESVGELAGGVAHDFNNLLMVIQSGIVFAKDSLGENEDAAKELDQVLEATKRAAELTHRLLAFGRRQQLSVEAFDLNATISNALRLLGRALPETLTIDFIAGTGLEPARGDPAQIDQVLTNLCLNARDAMDGKGRLTIETENVLINGEYRKAHPWAAPGRYVLLSVTDTGRGMTAEQCERAFEPFFTTKPPGQGTGLGLAMVHGIINQHGGHVHLYSEAGVGTTVKVYLPVAVRKAAEVGSKLAAPVPRGRETVLVAEDDAAVRRVVVRILERAGYSVLQAGNGREAIEVFESRPDEIAVVLLDAVMPVLGGRDAYERIREIRPGVRALFTSGYSAATLPTTFVERHEIRILQKPYDPDRLVREIRAAIDGKSS